MDVWKSIAPNFHDFCPRTNCIRQVLEEQGRTQTWLARKLDLAYGTVNAWCNNRSQPYFTDLIRAAEALEVAPVELIVDGLKKEKRPD